MRNCRDGASFDCQLTVAHRPRLGIKTSHGQCSFRERQLNNLSVSCYMKASCARHEVFVEEKLATNFSACALHDMHSSALLITLDVCGLLGICEITTLPQHGVKLCMQRGSSSVVTEERATLGSWGPSHGHPSLVNAVLSEERPVNLEQH